MIHVKVTCDNGYTWVTGINAGLEGAKSYFIGQKFMTWDGVNEVEHTAVKVEEV